MAITLADFTKIWASTSPLTPYSFSDANYQEGWNFIGSTPPARQMWDFLQKNNDEKMKYIVDNFLPLSGGTMTGDIVLADGGKPLSDAVSGTYFSKSLSTTVSMAGDDVAVDVLSDTFDAGIWVFTGHGYFTSTKSGKRYQIAVNTAQLAGGAVDSSTNGISVADNNYIMLQTVKILQFAGSTTVYLMAQSNGTATLSNATLRAVRIA